MITERIKFLKTIQPDFKVAELNKKENKPSSWIKLSNFKKDLNQIRFRQQLENEFILELDNPKESQNIKQFDKVLKPVLEEKNINYEAWRTHSKSLHINFFFNKKIDNNDRYSWLCETFGKKNVDLGIKNQSIDKSYFTKDAQLIAMENQPHYKSKQIKDLYSESKEKLNKFNIKEKIILKKETERKVKIKYGEILKNPKADEQERVSCVMQIFNKHQSWSSSELLDYIALHNKWDDYDPEITRQKIEEFILPKYKDKKNPLSNAPKKVNDVPTKDRVDFTKEIKFFENTHGHLTSYKMIDTNLGLQGDEYYSIKKYLVYFVESLKQPTLSFHVGTEPFDNRTHFATMIDPGHGKGKIKGVIKSKHNVSEINGSRTHIEQLIGKKITQGRGKNKVEIDNKGYFGCDGLVMDESQTLLCEEQSHLSAIMVEIRKACDPFLYNITEKKQVDNLDVMKYPPETRFSFLTHPVPLPALFFDLGTYRRMFCFQIKKNEKITKTQANANFFAANREKTLKEYINTPGFSVRTLDFQEEQIIQVLEWIDMWRAFTLNHSNQRIKTLGLNSFFSVPLYFFRLVAIASSWNGEITPTKKIIDTACFDCVQFLLETFQIYANKSQINLSRSIWETEDSDTAGLLEWVWFNGGSSEEDTELKIEQVQDKIMDVWGVWSERQAKRIYSKLKDKGYLKDYHSSGVSKCWLAFNPRIDGNINLKDYPKVDLLKFLKTKKGDIGDMSSPLSCLKRGTKNSINNIKSSTYNPNTTTTSSLTLNNQPLSPMSPRHVWVLLDGDLKDMPCSICGDTRPAVAEKHDLTGITKFCCESCFEGVDPFKERD